MKKPFLTLLLGTCCVCLSAQHFSLIKDINPGGSSNISYLTRIQNQLYFGANNGSNGMELWKSDGTSGGTVLVKDINPGSASSSIGYLTPVGNTLYFVASNGTQGVELWKSDGSTAGTVLVKDIRSGSASSYPSALAGMNGLLYFSASDGVNGTELWKSDGTAAGTQLLLNIHPTSSSSPQYLTSMGGFVYFSAENGSSGRELWRTDGTAVGTTMVKDIWPGSNGSSPTGLVAIGSTLFFSADNGTNGMELWKSDGTEAGTVMVKDIWTGGVESYPYNLRNINGTLYFSADNGANGMELWKSDGTSAGTVLVKDVWPGSPSGASGNFTAIINRLIFTGNDGVNGDQNWESDGTGSGTRISAISIESGSGVIREVQETDGMIYASVQESTVGRELYAMEYSAVLPLQFLEFTAARQGEAVQLDWKTASEENTEDFVIERSVNGRDFMPVGRVAANNRPGTHRYSFRDMPGHADVQGWYYRIRQNDYFGRFSYSIVVYVNFSRDVTVKLWPVPATEKVTLSGLSANHRSISYQLFDNQGRLVDRRESVAVNGGSLDVPVSSLAPGIYYLLLRQESGDLRLRLVKR